MKNRYKIGLNTLLLMACGQAWAVALDDKPVYQTEYELYLQDLGIIEQTGKAPENQELEADLAKMDSNERIRLTASRFSSTPMMFAQVQYSAPLNSAEVLNKVEVIRVPEEFREMYADIYQQQLEQQGDGLTKEEQEALNRLRGGASFDVVDHQNPFKEVSSPKSTAVISPDNSEDPMVNAYFSSNRAFVSGAPIIVPRSEYTPRNDFVTSSRSSSFAAPVMNAGQAPSVATSTVSVGGNATQSSRHSKRRPSSSGLPSLRRNMFVE